MAADGVATNAAIGDQPGRPYYENLRITLRSTLAKKRQIDEQLAALEDNIYKLEGNYLEDTSGAGNIVRGFDNWVKGVVIGGDKRTADEKRTRLKVKDEDRIFSRSSMSWLKGQDSDVPTSATNTPHAATPSSSVPPTLTSRESNHATPTSTVSKTTNNKKKKAPEKDDGDDTDTKSVKRGKISYG